MWGPNCQALLLISLLLGSALPGAQAQVQEPAPLAEDPSGDRPILGAPPAFDLGWAQEHVPLAAETALFQDPTLRSPVLVHLDFAAELPVLERRGGWVRVRSGGLAGWVLLDSAATEAPPGPFLTQDGPDPAALARARQQLPAEAAAEARALGPYALYTDVADEPLLAELGRLAATRLVGVASRPGTGEGRAMIEFVLLHLGLVVGPQPVAVSVSGEVAVVELRLDGRLAGQLHGPTWRSELDFGRELLPRRFEAIARDRVGGEIARARQWLNLPQEAAIARLFLAGDPRTGDPRTGDPRTGGGERTAELSWESTVGAEPRAVRVTFDGEPLAAPDPRRFAVPSHDPRQVHLLRAELDFTDNVTALAELTFGGTFADRVSTELTALPVADEGKKPPAVEALRGAFTHRGRTLEVVAVERGSAEIVMVVDRGFPPRFAGIWSDKLRHRRPMYGAARMLATGALERDQRLRFVLPVAEVRPAVSGSFHTLPPSAEYTLTEGGFYPLLAGLKPKPGVQRLADAVAVAGLTASRHRRRRVVVLALGSEPADASELQVAQARGYLAALRVPLVVWTLGAEPPPAVAAWGKAVDVASFVKVDAALRELKRQLDRQAMVWLDGFHLPQDVELQPFAAGNVRLVR